MILAALAVCVSALLPPPQEAVDQARLMETLRSFPAMRAALGGEERRRGLVQTETMIEDALRAMGYEPRLEPFMFRRVPDAAPKADAPPDGATPRDDAAPAAGASVPGTPGPDGHEVAAPGATDVRGTEGPWHNVIVDLPGTEFPREVLLIGAHFDAVPRSPGADDNASGAAALLEIARVLKDRPMKRTVRLVFFNLEEAGLVGARHHVRLYPAPGGDAPDAERLIGMVSLECIGYFSTEPNSQKSPMPPIKDVFEPPTVGDFIAITTTRLGAAFAGRLDAAMRAAEPNLKTFVASFFPDPPGTPLDVMRSDHAPFLVMKHPAIMLTGTANFRNPHYHKPTDTHDTLDPDRYTLVVRAMAGAVHTLAEPSPRP
ncbi:MAG: M20/M25/M40 family metallo-hydrolase [Phycisphaerales bacterium]|nr:M20/M25/M40 family metallo-hydrolase [Phycisphaerales bacterium]